MAVALDMQSADFDERFAALVAAKRETSADVDLTVADIIDDVRHRGDVALAELSLRFDRIEIGRIGLKIDAAEIDAAIGACDEDRARSAQARARPGDGFSPAPEARRPFLHRPARGRARLAVAADRRGRPLCSRRRGELSVLGHHERRAGQGRGLPPPGDGHADARTATSIRWRSPRRASPAWTRSIGSAARRRSRRSPIGTDTIAPVDKIVGPGNAYVAAAKRRVFGVVGIDMIAGPSEVVVLADRSADPRFVAADLLAQAEHDEAAQSILITDDAGLARAVEAEVERQLESLPRAKIAGASWRDNGAVILCPSLEAAIPLVDRLAPEHLEIMARRRRGAQRQNRQRRRDLPWGPYARGDRRLCRRIEPRPADRALGALLVGLGRARLHEAHVAAQMRRPLARTLSARRRLRLGKRRGSRRTHARSRCGFARTAHERKTGQEPQSARRSRFWTKRRFRAARPMSITSGRWRSST